jgi:gamma-glutamyltranspeptidase/glutathione hydrolase
MSDVGVGEGQAFTTRPEIRGDFGMVSSTHWLASAAAMRILEIGGNAFDSAVAAGFVLQVVQPHLNGPGGDMSMLVWDSRTEEAEAVCAQGTAPAAATTNLFRSLGFAAIPGSGPLSACVPGAMDGWLLLLRDKGTLQLRDVIEPAIYYSRHGYPVSHDMSRVIGSVQALMVKEWPTSEAVYLNNQTPPLPGSRFRNSVLAATYERLLRAAELCAGGREAQIDEARRAFYCGFVPEAIDRYFCDAEVVDVEGQISPGLITPDDLAKWSASWEPTYKVDFRGVTVCKAGPWSQAPVLLQQLTLLDGFDIQNMDRYGSEYVHMIVECGKLAFADREAWYGDPNFSDVPITTLLSSRYAEQRRALVTGISSLEHRPGSPDQRKPLSQTLGRDQTRIAPGLGEPTVRADEQDRGDKRSGLHAGDTCHVDVIDRVGNMVSATPSGGWLQSSPVIPGLGFALGTRMQMFDLDNNSLNQLQPGKRPRTTLSPTLALRENTPWMAFGTPGGDQQDQWSLQFLLNVVVFGDNLQLAIDSPVFQSAHFPSSFYPHQSIPGRVYIEDRYPLRTIHELRRRGHEVITSGPWSLTRVCAVGRSREGFLRGGANPRGMEAYVVGR